MTGRYCFAGYVFELNTVYDFVHRFCHDYVSEAEPDYHIVMTRQLILEEEEPSDRAKEQEKRETYPGETAEQREAYLETLAVYRKVADLLVDRGVLLLHGSVIAVDGEAYLFTAKSGTGKSTHTRLWREYFGERAVMINDDKPLVTVAEDHLEAHGTPWNGKHHLGRNISCRLKAICILTRGEENCIEQIPFREAYPMLVQQSHRPSDAGAMLQTLDLIDKMQGKVRFYRLACNMDPEAARVSFEGMQ